MDPMAFAAVKEIIPALVALAFVSGPVVWYWIKKNHEFRLKELELESGARVQELEKRLATVEALLGAQQQLRAPERPELFEAPPQPARQRG
ncbi:MAG TPA: hypothetical protein VLW85_16530 [Myxococcales bacterium]|nr:hypothetical protein [Myxococcales bacterium]